MSNFSLKRNASGYKDETAYNGIMSAPKPGEVWRHTQNNGLKKDILVIKNHGTFCTAIALVETEGEESFAIRIDGTFKYSDPRMIQYCYNSNFGKFHCSLDKDDFACVVEQIKDAIFPESEKNIIGFAPPKTETVFVEKEDSWKPGVESLIIDELKTIFGEEAVKTFCKLNAYKYKACDDDVIKGDFYINKLQELNEK